ncbi:hypothetical protein [Streptococcus hyointestinalis]|nr:hypothetical protein [Streptococcus hyointestinalis]
MRMRVQVLTESNIQNHTEQICQASHQVYVDAGLEVRHQLLAQKKNVE